MPKRHLWTQRKGEASDAMIAASERLRARETEALRVYRPGNKRQERIHTSGASTLLICGGNRSGKSVCSFAEFASRVTGTPMHDQQGNEIPLKWPVPESGGKWLYWIIGFDLDHIGQTIYRILFEPGLFDVILDKASGKYVSWNENIPDHVDRISKRIPAEPLIPSRLIEEQSWCWNPQGGGKASNCFESVRLKNGALIHAFPSSTPQPKQGDPVNGILVDEDVKYPQHVPEYLARLGDRLGWFLWPAWPHDENYMLGNLIDGCQKAEEEGDTRFEHIELNLIENPFFSDAKKQLQIDRLFMLGGEEMVASRAGGERMMTGRKMYDFAYQQHGISTKNTLRPVPDLDPRSPRGKLQEIWRRDGKFPDHWTRYMALDPSTARTAAAFGAVPPAEVEGVQIPPTLILENELVLKRALPCHTAMAVKEIMGCRKFEAFVIDKRFGQQTHASAGMASWDVYAAEFKAEGVFSRTTDSFFVPGCDVPLDRSMTVRKMLMESSLGRPALYILLDNCPETLREILRYLKKKEVVNGVERITDLPENPRKFDCMAALEYLTQYVSQQIAAGQHYHEQTPYETGESALQTLAARVLGGTGSGQSFINLGPSLSV